ncbi:MULTISPECIES: transglycosylase SLT domain-containing protein [Marinobacter]|uniref:transglycosylase SLT domain-containing protein n=1 Tax=Marinobacter TaxID=2742 RepID=UPI001CD28B87|nr:transglycosylase SLT domain-containing protein [Marinobacter nauticus]MCA0912742.1 murein transglycosylase domain-containing protein [Marinobacter nauticus]
MSRLRTVMSVVVLAWPLVAAGQPGYQSGAGGAASSYTASSGFEEFKKNRLQGFTSYKEQVQKEFQQFAKLHDQVSAQYEKRISDVWAEPEQSSKTRWVHYEDGYRIKRVVDFEQQQIIWSTPKSEADNVDLSKQGARQMLQALMVMTRRDAFEQDEVAREVEEQSRTQFKHLETATLDDTSAVLPAYLFGEGHVEKQRRDKAIAAMLAAGERVTRNQHGQEVIGWVFPLTAGEAKNTEAKPDPVTPPKQAPAPTESKPVFAQTEGAVWQTRAIQSGQREQLPARARPFVAAINKENSEFELSAELLLAIIETESAFNPMAKSSIPAFGLMQIVPASAGQDATEKLFGKPRLLAPSYLYNADNNIRIGAAYFNILYYRYFKGVDDPLSRLYCAIAAYNTGPGNVSLALTGKDMKLRPAIAVANTMTPGQVYEHLLNNLPYEETVNYLQKVTTRLSNYTEVLDNG